MSNGFFIYKINIAKCTGCYDSINVMGLIVNQRTKMVNERSITAHCYLFLVNRVVCIPCTVVC